MGQGPTTAPAANVMADRGSRRGPGSIGQRRSLAPSVIHDAGRTDPDLAAVIDSWDRLPEAVRAGIVAMVKAALT
jgi:hypothetical protein